MRRLLCLALVGVLAIGTPASAQDGLEAYEIATLGPEHAAEHAAARAAAGATGPALPAQQRRARPEPPADEVGRWSSATIDLPTWAINAVLLPTGKVALWGRAPTGGPNSVLRENLSQFWVWDPVSGNLNRHDAPMLDLDSDGDLDAPAPLFCSGQSLLADGQLFVAGGNLGNPDWMGGTTPDWRGLDRAYTFDPWSLTWREQPKPRRGRWYPSQVQLADGRIAIIAGFDETGTGVKNLEMEVFTPAAERGGLGTMTHHPAGDRDTAFYPHLFTLPSGKVLMGGPDRNDSALLDPAALDGLVPGSAWTDLPDTNAYRIGGNAVLWPQGAEHDARVTLLGGFTFAPHGGDAVRDTETFDADAPEDGWTLNGAGIPAMNVARSYGNVIQLPNGELVAVGGGAGSHWNEGDVHWTAGNQDLKRVELLRPGLDDGWTLGPAQQKWRAYHSTALLLPDGRVLSAGDDYWALGDVKRQHAGTPMDAGEIYSPPYLFDGDELAPRPRIDDAPAAVPYGAPFGVRIAGRDGARAVLVAPGATTHGVDMNQRLVVLETLRSRDGVGLDVRAPAGPAAAPPGYYMLFVLGNDGTPSVARWVRVAADAPAPPVLPDPTPTPTPQPTVTPAPTSTPTVAPWPTASPAPSTTPQPTVAPTPTPAPRLDRTAPTATLSLQRRGRRLQLRVKLSEAGRADLMLRFGTRKIRRTLIFPRSNSRRTIAVTPPRGLRRLTVTARTRDAAGNRRTVTRRLSVRWPGRSGGQMNSAAPWSSATRASSRP